MHSKVLNETVLWATNSAEVPPGKHLIVYRARELMELVGVRLGGGYAAKPNAGKKRLTAP